MLLINMKKIDKEKTKDDNLICLYLLLNDY